VNPVADVLLRERRDDVEILTLHRPEKRNALNLELVRALHAALTDLEADATLRAVVLTGAGDHFMAGADVAELRDRRTPEALAGINSTLFRRVEELPVPVIAALRGFALGGGCELALSADLRVAGRSVRLGQPEVGLGILPGAGATYRLPLLVGMGRAKEMILTGRWVEAEEALAIGLVNRVVDDDAVLGEALALAATIREQGALAVRLAKLALNAQRHGLALGQPLEGLAQGILFESAEKMERMQAFLERSRGREGSSRAKPRPPRPR
jgi:enoyl-CoA hydratase